MPKSYSTKQNITIFITKACLSCSIYIVISTILFKWFLIDDMKSPLSHYYIYTSHNTYLTGNQFTSNSGVSNSGVRPIIRALQKGVRGIGLDLWPNSTNTDINVCHGRTLTSSVKLRKCLKVIKDYAFHASEIPIFLINICSPNLNFPAHFPA